MSYEILQSLVSDGEPVNSAVTNRVPEENRRNILYLYDLLTASGVGSSLMARDVPAAASVALGSPVYLNTSLSRIEMALSTYVVSGPNDVEIADSSRIFGIVVSKPTATTANVLITGYAPVDILARIDGVSTDGLYYLSAQTPGRLTKVRPAIAVPVLVKFAGMVLLKDRVQDTLDRHTHYRFFLSCLPAGQHIPPAVGVSHNVTSPNLALPGWLPSSHASFAGLAPVGSTYGYNLSAHPALKAVWPPMPAETSYLEWSKGVDLDVGFTGVPSDLLTVNRNGIWWMGNCYGDVPWPTLLNTTVTPVVPTPGCPRTSPMELRLWFSRTNFANRNAVVTTLKSADPRLTITCEDGSPGQAGNLLASVNLSLAVVPGVFDGSLVLKELLPSGGIRQGRITEGVWTTSPSVQLSSDQATIPVDPLNPSGPQLHQGRVHMAVTPAAEREIYVGQVLLDGATQENHQESLYLGLAAGRTQGYRAKIDVPRSAGIVNGTVRFRFVILGRTSGILPTLVLTARTTPSSQAPTTTILPSSGSEVTLTLNTTFTLVSGNRFVEVVSGPLTGINSGCIVHFSLTRLSTDTYPGEVGILSQSAILAAT